MDNPLLKNLLAFYEEDPHDSFNIYALALEYRKVDVEQAEALFRKLLAEHPDYLATYYHAAQLFGEVGKSEEAHVTYKRGIELAQQQGNTKTYQELVRAYRMFQDEEEDW